MKIDTCVKKKPGRWQDLITVTCLKLWIEVSSFYSGCHGNDKLDLAFVVDRSNSLSSDDFLRAKYFIQNVVDAFDINPDKTRIAVVSYSSAAKTEFVFNDHSTKSEVKAAISRMQFIGGSTATAEAIDRATTDIFVPAHGSRPDAVKVMVVITDGDANDLINTGYISSFISFLTIRTMRNIYLHFSSVFLIIYFFVFSLRGEIQFLYEYVIVWQL